MNKKILTAVLGAAVVGFGSYSLSIKAATTTGNASAGIVTAISVSEQTPMSFGNIVADASNPCTATLDTSDSVVFGGAGTCTADSGTVASADFRVLGTDAVAYTLAMPANITLNRVGGGASMTVDTFSWSTDSTTSGTSATASGTIGSVTAGQANIIWGGVLNIAAAQTAGSYTGTYTITALYN